MEISKDKGVTDERLEEQGGFAEATKCTPTRKDDPGKVINQETMVDRNGQQKEFSISLSCKEIEDDLYKFKGTKLDEWLEEQAGFAEATQCTPTRKDDPGKAVNQEIMVDRNGPQKEFSFSLSRKEIEDDFYMLKETKSDERLEEQAGFAEATQCTPTRKDDPGKAVNQETMVDKNGQRMEFSISLSRKEIEDDFYIFKGTKSDERLEEQAGFAEATQCPPTRKDDPGKAVNQETMVDIHGQQEESSISLSRKEIEDDFYAFKGTKPDERLEEQAGLAEATQCTPTRKDDPGKAVIQETMVDRNSWRKNFSISLTHKEIEEDFYAMTGRKLNQEPRKRPEAVQKKLDALFPGFSLLEVTKSSSLSRKEIEDDFYIFKGTKPDERLEEQAGFAEATQRTPTRKDDPGKAVNQETMVDKNGKREEFSISLSRKEIEDDCYAFEGTKPDESLEEQAGLAEATQCTPTRKDDPGKVVNQETTVDKNGRRKEFSISLSPEEIEEDFYAITGRKPNPEPKKRPEAVQKKIDALFPGASLSEVTKARYKLPE